MNKPFLRIAAAAALLLFAALLLHSIRSAPIPPKALPDRLQIPAPEPVAAAIPEAPRKAVAGRAELGPERLLPFLERLGRARLVRDRRTLEALRRETPPLFEEDFDWIRARLSGELFPAAGAVELLAAYRRHEAVGDLAALLARPASSFLKAPVIETLASLGGDAAAAALVLAARSDPDEGNRARAAAALGGFAGPEAYITLAAALRDPSAAVRSAAAAGLSRLPSRETVEALLRAMAAESDPKLQADLAIAAGAAGGETWRESVVQAIVSRPGALAVVLERGRRRDDSRYRRSYPPSFFETGSTSVPRPAESRRIGITVETGPGLTLVEAALPLFGSAPLDRYRDWFRFRRAEEFPSPRAYDSYGNPSGEVPYDDLDGSVFLRFRDPRSFDPGVLGYAKGCEAFVSEISLLHEFGHAFARLADEYPEGSALDAANLARAVPVPWEPLIRGGALPDPFRRDASFLIPSAHCYMANRPSPTRYCPVCQLEIHARMAELAGAPLPW
jgi:hypothetical protein